SRLNSFVLRPSSSRSYASLATARWPTAFQAWAAHGRSARMHEARIDFEHLIGDPSPMTLPFPGQSLSSRYSLIWQARRAAWGLPRSPAMGPPLGKSRARRWARLQGAAR